MDTKEMDPKRLERVEDKIDKINDHLGSIDKTLAAQHESLKEHMRRTEILEDEMKPIKKHVDGFNGVLHMLKILATLGAILGALHMFNVF